MTTVEKGGSGNRVRLGYDLKSTGPFSEIWKNSSLLSFKKIIQVLHEWGTNSKVFTEYSNWEARVGWANFVYSILKGLHLKISKKPLNAALYSNF